MFYFSHHTTPHHAMLENEAIFFIDIAGNFLNDESLCEFYLMDAHSDTTKTSHLLKWWIIFSTHNIIQHLSGAISYKYPMK